MLKNSFDCLPQNPWTDSATTGGGGGVRVGQLNNNKYRTVATNPLIQHQTITTSWTLCN